MVTKRYFDVSEFHDRVKSYLYSNEVQNNLAIGVLNECIGKGSNPNHYFIASQVDQNLVSVLIQTMKNMIIIGELNVVNKLIEFLISEGVKLNGIIAQYDLGISFAKKWKTKMGAQWDIKMHQRIYRLEKVNEIRLASGKLRKANKNDKQLVIEWMIKSSLELGGDMNETDLEAKVEKYIYNELVYVWEDIEVVSMVRKARPTENSIVVTSVFTPMKFRNKGYATSCVYSFSKLLLEEHKYCTLYTDMANPTSNGIYKKIGYKPIADSVMISFDLHT